MAAVEPAKQGESRVGEDTGIGDCFFFLVDDFVGILETPEGLQKRIGKALL